MALVSAADRIAGRHVACGSLRMCSLGMESSQRRNTALTWGIHPADMREHRVAAGREPIVFLPTLHREEGPRDVALAEGAAPTEDTERPAAAAPDTTCHTQASHGGALRPPGREGPSSLPPRGVPSDADIALWFG